MVRKDGKGIPVVGRQTAVALALNGMELAMEPSVYGFGSYDFEDGNIEFRCFLPNLAYKPGLLPSLYFSTVLRAQTMNRTLRDTIDLVLRERG